MISVLHFSNIKSRIQSSNNGHLSQAIFYPHFSIWWNKVQGQIYCTFSMEVSWSLTMLQFLLQVADQLQKLFELCTKYCYLYTRECWPSYPSNVILSPIMLPGGGSMNCDVSGSRVKAHITIASDSIPLILEWTVTIMEPHKVAVVIYTKYLK